MTLKNNRAYLLCYFQLCATFHSHRWNQTWATVPKHPVLVKIGDCLSRMTLKFDGWPWKTIKNIFYATSSFVQHFIGIGEFKLELQSGNAQFGSKSAILCPVWPSNLTDDLENNGPPLLCDFNRSASFHSRRWIQTGVTVRKRSSEVWTSVTLTFDLWSWPFAWTSILSLGITPEKFMMIRWREHSDIGVTDWRTDGRTERQTDRTICRAAWSQLKTLWTFFPCPMHTARHTRWWSVYHYRFLLIDFRWYDGMQTIAYHCA